MPATWASNHVILDIVGGKLPYSALRLANSQRVIQRWTASTGVMPDGVTGFSRRKAP